MKRVLLLCLLLLVRASSAAESDSVSLLFAGDIVLDGQAGKIIAQGRDPFAEFAAILDASDIRVGNLECVVASTGDAEDKIYNFRAHPRTLAVLKRHFDAVSIANNHSGDFGRPAFAQMLGLLDSAGIGRFGGGHDLSEAHTPLIVERKGLRIALLGYNEFMPRSFEADADAPGTAWSEDEQVAADIRRARSSYHADLVIPIMHWGWENEMHANARQRQLAHLMIDSGADAVIGGHPHVTQDVEIYRGKPIVYSVGNFLIDALDNEAQTKGWVVKLELDRSGVKGWRTFAAQLDQAGVPHPVPGTSTPCGDVKAIAACAN
ncbi:MAG: CapA family protein [Burkholderiaceae bacterium]|nr:CapA family protein [Burkholderiaceae bacterium]